MSEPAFSPVPPEAKPYQGRPAGVVTRLVASSIDGLVVVATLFLAYGILSGVLFMLGPRSFSFPKPSSVFVGPLTFSVLVGYLTAAWSIVGRTYGDVVMGLRVVDRRGRNPQLPIALARAVFCAVFPIGLLWSAVSPANRSVQDVLLRTAVLYDWQPAGVGRPSVPPRQED